MTVDKKLRYVGRRAISKYGCSGCHDVPGFEDAKPIGTGLADWARKTPDKLAFEQIVEYMKHGHGPPGALVHATHPVADVSDKRIEEADEGAYGHTHIDLENLLPTPATSWRSCWATSARASSGRSSASRAATTTRRRENKGYNERLRMPQVHGARRCQARGDHHLRAGPGRRAARFAIRLPRRPAPQRDRPRQGGHREVQLHGLPHAGDGSLEAGLRAGRIPVAGQCGRLSVPDAALFARAGEGLRSDRHPRPAPRDDHRHAGRRRAGRPLRLDEDGAPLDPEDTATKAFYSFVLWDNVLDQRRNLVVGLAELARARVGRAEEVRRRWAASWRGWRIRWW